MAGESNSKNTHLAVAVVAMSADEYAYAQQVKGRNRRKDANFKWLSGMITSAHAETFQACKDWLNKNLTEDDERYTTEDTIELMIETMRHQQLKRSGDSHG